ncbi:MAG: hypothetical protein ABIF17_03210 [Patescibacteria group bacterium]
MQLPQFKPNQEGQITDINGKKIKFKVIKQVKYQQSNYHEKIFVLQDLLFENGKKEIRIGYYIIGKKPKMKGKWVWGQFCPLFPKKDLLALLKKAKDKKII